MNNFNFYMIGEYMALIKINLFQKKKKNILLKSKNV